MVPYTSRETVFEVNGSNATGIFIFHTSWFIANDMTTSAADYIWLSQSQTGHAAVGSKQHLDASGFLSVLQLPLYNY